jgi:hypothetical protein
VAQVYVRRGRVCAELYAQGHARSRAPFKLGAQILLADYLHRPFAQEFQLFVNRHIEVSVPDLKKYRQPK